MPQCAISLKVPSARWPTYPVLAAAADFYMKCQIFQLEKDPLRLFSVFQGVALSIRALIFYGTRNKKALGANSPDSFIFSVLPHLLVLVHFP